MTRRTDARTDLALLAVVMRRVADSSQGLVPVLPHSRSGDDDWRASARRIVIGLQRSPAGAILSGTFC
jgi:hypothetical protein